MWYNKEHCRLSNEFQQYCNYPEVSKPFKKVDLESEDSSISDSYSSSGLASFTSAVSDPSSQPNLLSEQKSSSSLYNYLNVASSSSDDGSTSESACLEDEEESGSFSEESDSDESEEEHGEQFSVGDDILSNSNIKLTVDPVGWIKHAVDSDPWNEKNYWPIPDRDPVLCHGGVLTHELVAACSSKIDQLPDSKAFVLTRLHLNKQGLDNISVLAEYKYFQYVDISWNSVTDLKDLNGLSYLMYLNAAHNKLSTVLNMYPPSFLTHVNLSCNNIRDIGDTLSNFWSLSHIDLSNNMIEKIEGLNNLKFLRNLNLSYNRIQKVENLYCYNLKDLNLEGNEISEFAEDGLQILEAIETINLSKNKVSCLLAFQKLYFLKTLDLSNNCVSELYEISLLSGSKKLQVLNMSRNPVCTTASYREFVIFKLPSVRMLDSILVSSSEHVAAKMLFAPDMYTSVQHLRAKIELWKQLAPQDIGSDVVPYDSLPIPLVILVGSVVNGKEDLAHKLAIKFPNQIYRCKKHTTMLPQNFDDSDNLISVSVDEFILMIKNGQFVVNYEEMGHNYGICRDELCKIVVDGKIGLMDLPLEAAMVVKLADLQPLMVLCVVDDIKTYSDKLNSYYMNQAIVNNANISEPINDNGFISRTSYADEMKCFCRGTTSESYKSEQCSISTSISSPPKQIDRTSKECNNELENIKKSKSVTWGIKEELISISVDSNKFIEPSIIEEAEEESLESQKSSKDSTPQTLSDSLELNQDQGNEKTRWSQSTESEKTKESIGSDVTVAQVKNINMQSVLTDSIATTYNTDESSENTTGDEFEWKWSFDSSTLTVESEPDEEYLNMVKGSEKFMRNALEQQKLYIEANNLQPSLFVTTVHTDDPKSALNQIEETCREVMKTRESFGITLAHEMAQEPVCAKFVQDRVSYLMNDLLNVSTDC